MPRTLEQIQTILHKHRDELAQQYGLSEIGIAGSYSRNEAKQDSDLDILVAFSRPIGFFKFLELEERLGELLGVKVDLVTRAALKPYIGKRILEEVKML